MAEEAVGFRGRKVWKSGSLHGVSGKFDANGLAILPPIPAGIAAGAEVVLARFEVPHFGYPVLEKLYLEADATGAGYMHFRVTANGQTLPYDWADTYDAIDPMRSIAENLPPGAIIEVRCKNESADGTLKAYCDGEVCGYEQPL